MCIRDSREAIEALRPRVRASFVTDTLVYLRRGGRCSALAAMAGGVLKLHPKIVVKDGAMDASKKYRGKIASVIMSYTTDMELSLIHIYKIDISSQHLLGIINDVLDMSKIEAGKTVFKYTDFSILDFITELNTIFHPQIAEKNQTLTVTKENIRHEWVNGDQVHLMQIFNNLLSNAVKYTQEGGKIQFLVEECETKSSVYAKYRFLVSDNGMGKMCIRDSTRTPKSAREDTSSPTSISEKRSESRNCPVPAETGRS